LIFSPVFFDIYTPIIFISMPPLHTPPGAEASLPPPFRHAAIDALADAATLLRRHYAAMSRHCHCCHGFSLMPMLPPIFSLIRHYCHAIIADTFTCAALFSPRGTPLRALGACSALML